MRPPELPNTFVVGFFTVGLLVLSLPQTGGNQNDAHGVRLATGEAERAGGKRGGVVEENPDGDVRKVNVSKTLAVDAPVLVPQTGGNQNGEKSGASGTSPVEYEERDGKSRTSVKSFAEAAGSTESAAGASQDAGGNACGSLSVCCQKIFGTKIVTKL